MIESIETTTMISSSPDNDKLPNGQIIRVLRSNFMPDNDKNGEPISRSLSSSY